jgi:hypothetical protein
MDSARAASSRLEVDLFPCRLTDIGDKEISS